MLRQGWAESVDKDAYLPAGAIATRQTKGLPKLSFRARPTSRALISDVPSIVDNASKKHKSRAEGPGDEFGRVTRRYVMACALRGWLW
jgi:hypothetical protein